MTYEQLKHLKPRDFKRRCGIQRETFEQMVEVQRPHQERRGKRGGQNKLGVEDQLLLVLELSAIFSHSIPHRHQLKAKRSSSVSSH